MKVVLSKTPKTAAQGQGYRERTRRPPAPDATASKAGPHPALQIACRARCASSPASSRPGRKHLGNYIGAIRQYVDGPGPRRSGDLLHRRPARDHGRPTSRPSCASALYDTTAMLLAAGLDPDRCVLFRQSDVREHTELTWLLTRGDGGRRAQPHAPVPRQVGRASASSSAPGCSSTRCCRPPTCWPTGRHEVPVGEDQREHLELMRDVAQRFNARFGEDILVVPEHRIPEVGARIMDLQDPTRKMSTTGGSEEGTRLVLDEPEGDREEVQARGHRLRRREIVRAPDKPGVSNLIDILAVARGVDAGRRSRRDMADARGYGDLKVADAEAVVGDARAGARALRGAAPRRGRAGGELAAGAEKARAIARTRSPTCARRWAGRPAALTASLAGAGPRRPIRASVQSESGAGARDEVVRPSRADCRAVLGVACWIIAPIGRGTREVYVARTVEHAAAGRSRAVELDEVVRSTLTVADDRTRRRSSRAHAAMPRRSSSRRSRRRRQRTDDADESALPAARMRSTDRSAVAPGRCIARSTAEGEVARARRPSARSVAASRRDVCSRPVILDGVGRCLATARRAHGHAVLGRTVWPGHVRYDAAA